jgi:hypothetical protein
MYQYALYTQLKQDRREAGKILRTELRTKIFSIKPTSFNIITIYEIVTFSKCTEVYYLSLSVSDSL